MKTIMSPVVPMRLRLNEHPARYVYVISIIVDLKDDDDTSDCDDKWFGYLCTDGGIHDDWDYTPQVCINGMWEEYE